jgi:hypothetical protein
MEPDRRTSSNVSAPLIAALVAVLCAVVIGVVSWALLNDDDVSALQDVIDDNVAAGDDGASDAGGSIEAVPLESVIDEMIAFVEQERGLEFVETPVVQTLPEDEFVAQLIETQNEALEEDPEEQELFSRLFHLLGFLPENVSLADAANALGTDGVLGYYETEDNELYVRGTEVTPFIRSVIVHELVHALDDQHFELFRPEYDDSLDEIGFGFSALVEGNARRIENEYVEGYSSEERRSSLEEQLGFSYDLSVLTAEYLELQLAPYTAGESYVATIVSEGGQEELDATFESPAVTSRAVLHPEQRDDPVVVLDAPEADGEVIEEGVVGEMFLTVMLSSVVGGEIAADTADNLASDWFVIWEDGEDLCFRAAFAGDTEADNLMLYNSLIDWATANSGTVGPTPDGNPMLTICG